MSDISSASYEAADPFLEGVSWSGIWRERNCWYAWRDGSRTSMNWRDRNRQVFPFKYELIPLVGDSRSTAALPSASYDLSIYCSSAGNSDRVTEYG